VTEPVKSSESACDQGAVRRPGMLVVDASRCHGCQSCMVACSLVHEGMVVPELARIRIALDPFHGAQTIHYCHQCRRAPCADACPQSAIVKDEDLQIWVVDHTLCVGCGLCVDACPFGIMRLNSSTGHAYKCDVCGGDPECVKSCPSGALTWRWK